MKKLSLAYLTGTIFFLSIAAESAGQGSSGRLKLNADTYGRLRDLNEPDNERKSFGSARLNSFNVKAVRHFERSFTGITDKHWYALEDGSIVYFKKDGLQMKAAYDERGNWLHNFRFYQEKYLPRDVRHIVKREYYDYAIYLVVEIEKDNQKIYLVKMESENALVMVRVCDDEMMEVERYQKSLKK